jgi:hypothetical protein
VTPTAGLLGVALGRWNDPSVFPFVTDLAIYWGCAVYVDPFTMPPPVFLTDFVTGVATLYVSAPPPLQIELFPSVRMQCCGTPRSMLDLTNSVIGGAPNWGVGFQSDLLLSVSF